MAPRLVLALAALVLCAAQGCGVTSGGDGGAAERTAALRAAEAERNLAASQTVQPRISPAPRS